MKFEKENFRILYEETIQMELTLNDWKEFREHLASLRSKRLLDIERIDRDFSKKIQLIKKKFLFWNYLEYPSHLTLRHFDVIRKIEIDLTATLVPEETFENCLNWKLSQEKKPVIWEEQLMDVI